MSSDLKSIINTDRDILNAIKNGNDNHALSVLYKELYPKVKRYIRQNGGVEQDAEDIFQNAVLIFYTYVKQNKFKDTYEIGGFIYTVCKNLWIKEVKKSGKLKYIPEVESEIPFEVHPEEALITEEREELVRSILYKMSTRCRQILYYSVYLKLSTLEIAKKIGLANEDSIKTRKYKCKKKLVEYLKKHPLFKNGLID